ncbi:MAG: ABC transporter permease [Saprospiraceae bacterium]|nr:ABC transporter permease [Saprospiraceae bacterium]
MNLLKLSWKNLSFKPWSTALSVILFALGIALISLLFLLQSQLQKNFERNLAGIDLVIGAKGSPLQPILSSMYHIDAPTGNISLQEAKPFLNPKHPLISTSIPLSMGDSYKGYRIIGTEQDFLDLYDVDVASGRIWEKNFEATIGAAVADKLGLSIGSKFASSHGFMDDADMEHDEHAFEVVGILEATGSVVDQLILVTTQSFWLVHEHEELPDSAHTDHDLRVVPKPLLEEDLSKEITSLLVKFKGRNFQALNMQRGINENTDLQAATPAIEINRVYNLMSTGEQVLTVLAFVIIFVSGLSIFISLFSSLRDRKHELALMRVMGSTPRRLFALIIIEGLTIAVVGYVLGMLLSHIGMEVFANAMQESYRYSFSGLQFLKEEGLLLVGALVLGFLAAVLPAWQASKTDISETLANV